MSDLEQEAQLLSHIRRSQRKHEVLDHQTKINPEAHSGHFEQVSAELRASFVRQKEITGRVSDSKLVSHCLERTENDFNRALDEECSLNSKTQKVRASPKTTKPVNSQKQRAPESTDPPVELFYLFEDVEEFARRLEAGEFFSGWGWDPEIQEERAWGDETWTIHMRSLFKRLDQAFDRGARAATLTCYRRLLMLLTQDAESGLFCGIKTPIEMLDIKLSDTLSRYFRSVYDCADRQSRVAQLAQAMIELSGLDRSLGLQSLIVVSHDKLNDFEDFLIEWQNYWRTRPCDRSLVSLQQWTVICQCFVREASQLIRGLPGLAWLARERGATQAESYFHWISRLIEVQDWVAAERAAREASERIQEPVSCALVSEVYAVIAAQNDSLNASLSALKQAFRKAPSPRRLCNLLLAHPLESRAKTLRIEIEQSFVDAEHFDDRTLSFMDFLAGRFEAALVRFQNAPELGWSDDEHPGRLLLPAFLWVCRREIDPQSIIKRIWRSVGRTIQSPEADQNLAAVFSSCGLQDREYWIDLVRPDSTILMSQLIAPDDLSTQRKKVLEQELKALVVHRVRTIVSKKYRKAYDRAATASVAVAELLASTEPESYLLPELKTIFPRHRAFLRELRKMAELSPVDLHFP